MKKSYLSGFLPYALSASLIGLVGGFSTILGPAFVRDMELDYVNTTWTALAQAMSTAACAPVLGKLGDVLGRWTTLLAGLLLFMLGNILTALSPSLGVMLLARFLVGIGTAAITPVVMAYIVTDFPPDKTARGFSLYMLISSLSVIFGPTLGGLIVAAWGWRSMMWLCSGLSGAAFLICLALGGRNTPRAGSAENFDGFGAALIPVFFSLTLCIPSFGQNFGWNSPVFLAILAAALISLAGLIAAEKRAENPILPGRFMRRSAFILSVVILFLTQGLMQANMTNMIVFVNYTQPENTLISSWAISLMYLGMSLGALILGPLADRLSSKAVLAGALILTGAACSLMGLFSPKTSPLLLAGSLGLLGFGLGGNGTILMKVALSGLSAGQAGAGTGTYGLFRDLSAPFGVAVFVPLFTNRITTLTAAGVSQVSAAVSSIHTLAIAQLLCIALGLVAVFCLPKHQ